MASPHLINRMAPMQYDMTSCINKTRINLHKQVKRLSSLNDKWHLTHIQHLTD